MHPLAIWYARLGMTKYPDDWAAIRNDPNRERAEQWLAECAYYQEYGELPEWGVLIERVEPMGNGGLRFIQRNPDAVQ